MERESAFGEFRSQSGDYPPDPRFGFAGTKNLPSDQYERFAQWCGEVSGGYLESGLNEKVEAWFTPYFDDQKTFEASLAEMENALNSIFPNDSQMLRIA